jgi:hypothetical protein
MKSFVGFSKKYFSAKGQLGLGDIIITATRHVECVALMSRVEK